MHKLGNWYQRKRDGRLFLMGRGKLGFLGLVDLVTGIPMRWVPVQDMFDVTQPEFNRMTHFMANEFERVENPYSDITTTANKNCISLPGGTGYGCEVS